MQNNLKQIRESKNISQPKAAEDLGYGLSTYRKYENGTRRISDEKLVQLSSYFNASIDVILGKAYKVDPTSPQFQKDAKTRSFLNAIVTNLTPQERSLLHELLSKLLRAQRERQDKTSRRIRHDGSLGEV